MLIGKSLMFIHNPRTGGTSVRRLLQASVPEAYRPVNDPTLTREQKTWALHQGMPFAHQYARRLGLDPLALPTLVCVRNPYAHVLSGYRYLAERPAGDVPDLEPDFGAYVRNLYERLDDDKRALMERAPYGLNSTYVLVGHDKPPNVTVARTEQLAGDVAAFLRDRVGVEPAHEIAHENASASGDIADHYGAEEEEIVYRLHRQMFDRGLYERFAGLSL